MAVSKSIYETVLQIEVENGVDDLGNTVYKKKNFSKIKEDATDENIYNVADAISVVLANESIAYFLEQNFIMRKESAPQE